MSCHSYHIALKLPNGNMFYTYKEKGWEHCENINHWIRSFLTYKNIIAYNDDEPDDDRGANVHSRGAHAKGVVAYDKQDIVWMIHSIPNYPEFKNVKNVKNENDKKEIIINDIDPSQLIYGQSVIMLKFPYSEDQLHAIYGQLNVMNAHIYYHSCDYSKNSKKKDLGLIQSIVLGEDVQHFSKHEKWGKDLFEYLSTEFDMTILCETWCKPASPSTNRVKNVRTVKWSEQLSYSSTNDHSKYAVSMNEDKPYVFIGDINHMDSQVRRGGGGVLIKNKDLWKAFHSILPNYNDVIENPQFKENQEKCFSILACFGLCK
jgi:deoxyribonuclease-2